MKIIRLFLLLTLIACNSSKNTNQSSSTETAKKEQSQPNILLITLDDMNWNSPAIHGGDIPNITPHIDKLATSGVMFQNAYVQAPNCSPSRVVIQTGLYPHQSGMRGFFFVENTINTLSVLLKENGYYTGVLNKKSDTSIHPDYDAFWDTHSSFTGDKKRCATVYGDEFEGFLKNARQTNKPYYCVLNIADPHKPFFNDDISKKQGFDNCPPSTIYGLNEVTVPEFLPETPKIKQQILNYYNSVKRGDDCVGEVLKVLKTNKDFDNTIVILLSDHGMPFPYAKSTVYQNGLKTPLIVSWPKQLKPFVNKNSLVSAIDIAPTLLDITGISKPSEMTGNSFLRALKTDEENKESTYVFGQYDENAGGIPRPSRTAISKRYGYIFNPWATGEYKFISASTHQLTYKQMKKLATTDEAVKKRFNFWLYRSVEEFYDYEKDPNALHNLINHPDYKEIIEIHRTALQQHMMQTNDYTLAAFNEKENVSFLNNWMKSEVEAATIRSKTIKWKRGKNHLGSTKNNSKLFNVAED
ncbi:N-sulfoglucosamine sulfohydrolase [Kordia periserrulae]|uniref:N-sulfoglucosamine sulfohydrolase n=1 Tax=Kordia periserrulae TaxID=701523 RepID=A0A2T6C089_9FLAO|nr:sulfatase [Kordia periserrulae]PTX61743.1 N-sulfoglucosamine sulfohydrolase [Kordia periserrulae]